MDEIVSLCKRRGFIYPSSEIYGGFAATYDYGPMGVLLKNNIKNAWWQLLVHEQDDVVGLDAAIFSHPKTWEASGHVESFTDPLVEDKVTHERLRADHLLEEYCDKNSISQLELSKQYLGEEKEISEMTVEEMGTIIEKAKMKSSKGNPLTPPRVFNLLVEAKLGATEETKQTVYLRGETCQAIFLQFDNVLNTTRVKLPFGIAQVGKAFRNEITTKQFILRTREFEQMEFEFFVHPDASFEAYDKWEDFFVNKFLVQRLGIDATEIRLREIPPAERSHYAKKQKDFEVKMANGKWQEVSPMNHRGDWDLSRHGKFSGHSFEQVDAEGKKYIPNVIETSFGLDRLFYLLMERNYEVQTLENGETRNVLHLPYHLSPIKIAVFPLVKNKAPIIDKAKEVFAMLKSKYLCEYDDNGNIGKRYRRQDEIGTPFCVTIDYDTVEKGIVTVRNRDTMKQEKVSVDQLVSYFAGTSL